MIFYLKVNRTETYIYRNLQNWLDIVQAYEGAKAFIQCDNDKLKEMILDNTNCETMKDKVSFIKTQWNNDDIEQITSSVIEPRWYKAAYAHLTTFLHAKQNGYERFWNIDADDTVFCISPERTVECLKSAEKYAEENDIKLFSLDMHFSDSLGWHWTYGITYTDNRIDWIGYMKKHVEDKEISGFLAKSENRNIDWYTTCLRNIADYKIETFYIENLKFIHYSEDFFKRPLNSGMRHWKDGKLIFPIILYGYGRKDIGVLSIPDSCVRFDENILDDEAGAFLSFHAHADDRVVMSFLEKRQVK
jgi:hypothetical protein